MFESCNSEDKDNNHCADTVLIIYRDAIKTGTRSTQQIYCHRAVISVSPILGKLFILKLAERDSSVSVASNNDGILKVEVPHFGLEPAVYHKCIKLLYTGFYLFVKDNSLPHQPRLGDKEWIEDKDGAKVISDKLYINHFFEDKISEKRSLETVILESQKIYWTQAEKALARKTLGDHFGIDDVYVTQHNYRVLCIVTIWNDVGLNYWWHTKDRKVSECTATGAEKFPRQDEEEILTCEEAPLYHARDISFANIDIFQSLTEPDCILRSSDFDEATQLNCWELKCHMSVLIAWSEVFKNLLLGSWNDSKLMDANGKRIVTVSREIVPNVEIMQIILSGMYIQSLSMCGYNVQTCVNCRGAAEYFQLKTHCTRL